MLTALWPQRWSRQQCSNATLVSAVVLTLLALALLGQLLSFLPEPIGSNAQAFAGGARTTLCLTLVSGSLGLALGTGAALARTARWPGVRWVAGGYIWIIRGTPLLVQILFVYFALPVLVPGLNLPDFAAAVLALGLNVGAYNAEAIRAGLLAVARGQTEAARALGLSRWHVFLDVVFPQAFRISLPPLVNNFVALLKDSSLAYAIGVVELTNVGNRIQSATFQPIATLSTVAVTYLLLTTLVTQISDSVEYRFDVEGRNP
ncbi:amino acid ABC transporter permease [Verminephrobacter aporrectodeae]|uniref:Amino acid ABC transporter permease n=1 Tax=Verminephrobacter aporrectodeae subsp. tuberculatae TaxID=1110392 RepID=A0ABT3KSR6_9BURK|nr:amino acid ABC transporter permease [Verminephrobacter aporrectodeae]MCW5257449.1 amino acid ABC transporter permease [Verminephrobacter aporrectodeae subsp. tuberculatae]MCW5321369.1 amino acid ABC transporter permease [Verminephrobacter aporrectodeae subsp. tuberculatae]MCW8175659.1 amino acid ABC transporter permease [Verminephrobacter aporrectodeae subsp. tuberculatae]MCW8203244.1 amino acid ABC transporter permease [Verminephrobacter aporrectodeae subsp. tuberculatae]